MHEYIARRRRGGKGGDLKRALAFPG